MSVIQIVCDNCGAKYKLPESFTAASAKCKACGSAIDVQGQRQAAASPARAAGASKAAAPAPAVAAGAKPAKKRSEEPAGRKASAGAAAGRRGRRGKDEAGEAEGDGRPGRRGRERPAGGGSKMPLVLGGVGVLAIAVVAILMLQGDGKPATTDTAQQPPASQPEKPADKPAAQPADATAARGDAKPAEASTPVEKPVEKPVEQPAATTPETKPETKPETDEPEMRESSDPSDRWKKSKVTSMDMVFDPKTSTEPLAWPAGISEADQQKVVELLDTVRQGGRQGPGAKTELEKMGFTALAGIINRLREVDYKDSFESMYAWELNKLLDTMTVGINMGFVPVEIGEDVDPRKADWNAKTAKGWQRLLTLYPDAEAFQKMRTTRLTRHNK